MPPDIRQSDPRRLAEIIDLDPSPQRIWREDEYGPIFQHQLSVVLDLGESAAPAHELAAAPGPSPEASAPSTVATIGQVLFDRSTVAQLVAIKDFAKANASHPDSALPHDVAEGLYYLAIAVGMVRHDQRLTRLANPDLSAGLRWALSRPWMDARSCAVLQKALQEVGEEGENLG
jgi:hypothetical protein